MDKTNTEMQIENSENRVYSTVENEPEYETVIDDKCTYIVGTDSIKAGLYFDLGNKTVLDVFSADKGDVVVHLTEQQLDEYIHILTLIKDKLNAQKKG